MYEGLARMLALIDDYGGAAPGRGGTEWFGFGAVLISDEDVSSVRHWFNEEILAKVGRAPNLPLTFSPIRSHSLRYHLIRLLVQQPVYIVVAAIRTDRITYERLQQQGWSYRYYGKEVICCATQYARELQEPACVLLHEHLHWTDLGSYLSKLECNSWYSTRPEQSRICFDRLAQCETMKLEEEPLLSLADWVANASYNALIPDRTWGVPNPTYLNLISGRLWKGPSSSESLKEFGFLLFPVPCRSLLINLLPVDLTIPW